MPLIAFSGLPAIGKTTIAKLLAAGLSCRAFLEPEENQWPEVVQHRYPSTEEITFFWFRSIRGNNLFLANQVSKSGNWSIVDTMYEHIRRAYIENHKISRTTKHSDFQDVIEQICSRDWDCLIRPDICFFLRTDEASWRERLKNRNRISDRALRMEDQFGMQEVMERATKEYCQQKGIICKSFRNDSERQEAVVTELLAEIQKFARAEQ